MKKRRYNYSVWALITAMILATVGCTKDFDELELATYPKDPNVFIDGFSAGLNYAAFGGSKVTAFDVDEDIKYKGSSSMKFSVPDFEDPEGAYAGGAYYTAIGRDLSDYDALTFWARASKPAVIDLVGFGNDLDASHYSTTLPGISVNTNWKKYIIPIPDASKLTAERGMFFYSEGPEDSLGYTFWIDELKFEKLGTIAHSRPAILEEQDQAIVSEVGEILNVGGCFSIFNMPTGIDQRVNFTSAYFDFTSSDTSVAQLDKYGAISIVGIGQADISAKLKDIDAKGSMSIDASAALPGPDSPAPTPTQASDDVISMFSDAYSDVSVDTWNTYWINSTAEILEGIKISGDEVKRYRKLNFVGIEFSSQSIDASEMTHFHLDLWTPDPTSLPAAFKIMLIDFGADGNYGGDDDASHEISITSPELKSNSWVSIDVPLSSFIGLVTRENLSQMVLSGDLSTVYIDNVYFYDDGSGGGPTGPQEAAPVPSHNSADVISVFSDTYTSLANTDFYPSWGQSTSANMISLFGNSTLLYAGLDYQGIVLENSVDVSGMTTLHVDFWTDNSSSLNIYLISPGPVEKAYALSVPTTGWTSVEIPLTEFSSTVDLTDVFQLKTDGNGDIYVDNIYFHK